MSDINYENINAKFPAAGEDNDTQVFRDNFAAIQHSLQTAKTEVGDLQTSAPTLFNDNDFNGHVVENAVFRNTLEQFGGAQDFQDSAGIDIYYDAGSYQVVTIKSSTFFNFLNWPGDPAAPEGDFVGKVMLEIYGEHAVGETDPWTVTIYVNDNSGIQSIKKNDVAGVWTVSEPSPVPGHVSFEVPVEAFPDNPSPIMLEMWRRGDTLFLNYLGVFS